MKKISLFLKNQGIVSFAIILALTLIASSLFYFMMQVNSYINTDMRVQIDAIQKNSTGLIRNELNYLSRLTASAAQLINKAEVQTDEDILQTLKDYARSSNVVRALFITLDGHAYTSYTGYLGQSDQNTSIDDISLSEIKEPIFSKAYYSEDIDEIVFGVLSPVTMGEKKGVLVSSYNISQFYKLLENEFIGGSAEIGIINNKGNVVVGKTIDEFQLNIFDSLSAVKFSNSSVDEMRTNFAKGISGFSSYCVNGIERYCSYAPVMINDWYVVVMVKEVSLRSNLVQLEKYGIQLTIELVTIMVVLLFIIITARYKEQKKIRMILQQAAMLDGLTGIYNRSTTESEIIKFLASGGKDINSAMLVIDIDNFKMLNDKWGHVFGDSVLKECAQRLKGSFEKEDIIGRMGGDEFVVLIKNCIDVDQIQAKVNCFTNDFYVVTDSGEKLEISVSIGLAISKSDVDSFIKLYQQADTALYRAKQNGKGKLCL